MKVQVKMIGPLMYETGFSDKEFEIPDHAPLSRLLALIQLKKERPKIITRNGKAALPEEELQNGDRIAISPIYSGG
jgi:molybdopterin converting factor small subunit